MCAEAVWWRCHRRIVADYAITRRVPVFHIFTAKKAVRATRTPFAKLDRRTKTLRYPRQDGGSGTRSRAERAPRASRERASRRTRR